MLPVINPGGSLTYAWLVCKCLQVFACGFFVFLLDVFLFHLVPQVDLGKPIWVSISDR